MEPLSVQLKSLKASLQAAMEPEPLELPARNLFPSLSEEMATSDNGPSESVDTFLTAESPVSPEAALFLHLWYQQRAHFL